ncbi:helix-turn-helix domain-containing protein [Pseudomonas cichorii]|uniref:helix-turn-helix domain-containing protein n=1 Tax=Pseudomonas cichorii TaxID=36746 RepID=UPI0035A94DC2
MKPTEFRNAHSFSIKRSAGLLRRNWRGHSVVTPVCLGCFVFSDGHYAREIGLVQRESLKSCASNLMDERIPGERLREERERLGLSQEDLAQAGSVNRNTQGSYERGVRNPDTSYLAAVASLGIDAGYVVTGVRQISDISSEEATIIEQYRLIPDEDRKALRRFLRAMVDDIGSDRE